MDFFAKSLYIICNHPLTGEKNAEYANRTLFK